MLDKKTDFPQSQSVQNGIENKPLLFDREFILEDGQEDVRLFGDSYFVLDVGAAIGADDFRTQTPGPDEFFVTPLAKRVFVDLEEMRRTAFVKDIIYFLDAPNYQQALFISKENAGQTITLGNCRGLASAISLFDWDELIGNLNTALDGVTKNTKDIQNLTAGLEQANNRIDDNTENININAQNIAQRVIAPDNTNWFLQASEEAEGRGYFLDNSPSGAILEIGSAQVFNGVISAPFVFSGDAQIFLRAKNREESGKNLSVELLVNGVSAGSAQYILNPGLDFSTVNITIPSVKIDAKNPTDEAPYPIALIVTPDSGVVFSVGGMQISSLMQFQGGGETGNSDIYIIGDVTALSLNSSPEEIEGIFGGPGGFTAFRDILKANPQKLVAIKYESGGRSLSPITATLLQNELSVQFFVNTLMFIFSIVVDAYSELTVSDYEMAQVLLEVPAATKTTLGGIIVGDNLAISEDGVLSAVSGGGDTFEAKKYNAISWGVGTSNRSGTLMEMRSNKGVFFQILISFSLSGTIYMGQSICEFIIPRIDRSKVGGVFYTYIPIVDDNLGTILMAAQAKFTDNDNAAYPNTSRVYISPLKNLTSIGYAYITGAWNVPILE